MPRQTDRTPSDVAYIRLHAHRDSTDRSEIVGGNFSTITGAVKGARQILAHATWKKEANPFYRIDIMAYRADGKLWHDLPLNIQYAPRASFRAAVLEPAPSTGEAATVRAAAAAHRARVSK